jgi:formyltetrahydrofolate-dependent phosphoribosylglycinamide formyltransferase
VQRIAVLASGGGSNLQAIMEYFDALGDARPAAVVLAASDRADAGALERARRRGVATAVLAHPAGAAALLSLLADHRVDVVALAGYLRLVPPEVVRRYRGRMVNIHPALLPKFGGAGMYGQRVHEAVLAAGESVSGATVHFVDEAFDRGPIIAQSRVPVLSGDTADSLAARVLVTEHTLYPRVLHALTSGLLGLGDDGRVALSDPVAFRALVAGPEEGPQGQETGVR